MSAAQTLPRGEPSGGRGSAAAGPPNQDHGGHRPAHAGRRVRAGPGVLAADRVDQEQQPAVQHPDVPAAQPPVAGQQPQFAAELRRRRVQGLVRQLHRVRDRHRGTGHRGGHAVRVWPGQVPVPDAPDGVRPGRRLADGAGHRPGGADLHAGDLPAPEQHLPGRHPAAGRLPVRRVLHGHLLAGRGAGHAARRVAHRRRG